tara:strand:+ start:29 stop:859 length:831 start_codon:yes stop_codon:yes gene_type:complete
MKLLIENWRQYLKEAEEAPVSTLSQIQQFVRNIPPMAQLADTISEDHIKDLGKYIYVQFPNQLKSAHIQKHFDSNSPGSSWKISEDEVSQLIMNLISKEERTKEGQEGPAYKIKWTNVPTGKVVGFDSLIKKDPKDPSISTKVDLERFGMVDRVKDWDTVAKVVKDYEYELVTCGGSIDESGGCAEEGEPYAPEHLQNNIPAFIKQNLGIVPGNKTQNPTKLMNVITGKLGEVNGKPVLSLITTFPGNQPVDPATGNDLTNKKDFKKYGYYFLSGE